MTKFELTQVLPTGVVKCLGTIEATTFDFQCDSIIVSNEVESETDIKKNLVGIYNNQINFTVME